MVNGYCHSVKHKNMITVAKLNPQRETKIQYQGEVVEHLSNGVIIRAYWSQPTKKLGYVSFEPGDRFIEYYYTDRWYNIFDIANVQGVRKGWYCNIAEPAILFADRIEQVDLFLDVWVSPEGETLILDEAEFTADTTLSTQQRTGARQALQELLQMIADHKEAFST